MTRDDMVQQLKENVCTVTFTKVNGESRTMTCTLMEDRLPAAKNKDSVETVKKSNLSVINVYDVNAQGWRSFKVDSVKEFEVENVY
jgi:hypothetical protein